MHLDQQSSLRNIAYFIPALIWGGIVTLLSLTPGANLKKIAFLGLPFADKIGHTVFYAVFVMLVMYAFRKGTRLRGMRALWSAVFLCCVFGVILEVLQWYCAVGRSFEVTDIIANIIGALLGSTVFNLVLKRRDYGS